jgi:hypothetical protein
MSVITATFISIPIICLFFYLAILRLNISMHRKERMLLEKGIAPSRTEVRQSVTLSKDGKGVISTPVKSATWFARLAQKRN